MLRLLLLETTSAFVERLAAALSSDDIAMCERMSLKAFGQSLSDSDVSAYDAIVLDLRQQYHDLRSTCRRVYSRLKQHCPLVAVTSLDNVDAAIRLVEAGADEVCLRNECDADFLMKRIRMAVARYDTQATLLQTAGAAGYSVPLTPTLPAQPTCDSQGTDDDAMLAKGPTVHVLCIDPWKEVASHETLIRTAGFDLPVNIQSVSNMREAVPILNETTVDVAVARLEHNNDEALDLLTAIRAFAPDAHVFFSARGAELDFLVEAVRHGADDFLADTVEMSPALIRCIRVAFARKWRNVSPDDLLEDEDGDVPRSQPCGTAGIQTLQERSPRYFVTKSAVAIPINPDFTPDETMCAEGFTIDISKTGVGFEIGRLSELPSELLLAGVEGDDGTFYFATVQVQHWKPQGGRLHVGAKFAPPEHELLRNENLLPSLRPDTQRFTTGLPSETLLKWAELGILRPVLVDRIYVCPKCESMPTFRKGCRSCGSIHIASHELILHADCAYLGVVTEFDRNGTLICPKCGTSESNRNGGFERHHGPCRCLDCNWSDSDTEVVGQCLQCRWHFPLQNASEHELIGFAVNRLDPQAFFSG
ncbi:MAG: TackOD1 domain-containing metal-binding protein [Pirellulaceae bacterium]